MCRFHPAGFPALRGLDTLAVDHRRTRLRVTSLLLPHLLHQRRVELLPQPAACPAPEVAIHRLPRREALRQHAPRAAAAGDVKDGVDDPAQSPLAGAPAFAFRQQRFQDLPFGTLKVGRVGWLDVRHPPSLPDRLSLLKRSLRRSTSGLVADYARNGYLPLAGTARYPLCWGR